MSVETIISDWKKKQFRPIYWLEGEEEYFIDKAVNYAEHHILTEAEASFNLSIFYGKDANWADILNACRRYPMFAERQVVLLKEAQQMKDVEKLEPYMENPLASTILVVSYKDKKLDARKKFTKLVKEKGVVISTKKLYDRDIPAWTQDMVHAKGLSITPKGLALLADHIGNDLSRIENEIEKLSVNLGKRTQINEDDIERYIGVSKEFNVFELQSAIASRDLARSIRIVQYFESNPKANPIQLVAAQIGVNPFFVKDYIQAYRIYGTNGIENILMLLHHYNLQSIGVGNGSADHGSLMKEMVIKMMS